MSGLLVFAFPLAYLPGWWRLLSGIGVVMEIVGIAVIFYGLMYHRTDA
jgi:hypothetical protein